MDFAKAADAVGRFWPREGYPAGAEIYCLPSSTNAEDCACESCCAFRVFTRRHKAGDQRVAGGGRRRHPGVGGFEPDAEHGGIELDQAFAADRVITEEPDAGCFGSCPDPVRIAAIEHDDVAGEACDVEGFVGRAIVKARREDIDGDTAQGE